LEFEGFTDPTIGRCYTFNHPKSQTYYNLQDSGEENGKYARLASSQFYFRPINAFEGPAR
jgi:hypothetical protein